MEPFNEVDKSKSSQPKKSKPSWKAATDDQKLEYNDILFRKLIQENVPQAISSCQNPRCDDTEHLAEIDSFVKAVLDDINEAANETIPKIQPRPENAN